MLRAIDTAQRTDKGRQRRDNEDASYAHAPVFVVADGMGGAQAGEVASRIAIETFEQGLPQEGPAEDRLAAVVQKANRQIYELSHAAEEHAGMGTTVTAAYLDDGHVAIAHVGDSRAYMFRDGELVRLTRDHSLVDELVQRGKLTEEEALEHPQRSIITRALGIEMLVQVDTWSYPVQPADVLLLCSDGLTSMLADGQIARILDEEDSLRAAADRLIEEANAAGGRDNITVILFRVGEGLRSEELDQPTIIGLPPVQDSAPSTSTGSRRGRARLARTQGHARRDGSERHLGRLGKVMIALVSTSIVLFIFGGAGYLASRQLYFLGTDSQGMVAVYRGFPYALPFGIRLYETFYVSGVPASLIPADRRATLLDHDLRSQSAATNLINDIELGQVSG
jgi:PPM family protein phosphatase